MNYYRVWVASTSYRRDEPLTYSYSDNLRRGQIVLVTLQQKRTLGVVEGNTTKPTFEAVEIISVISNQPLGEPLLQLIGWLMAYYPAPLGSILMSFLPSSLQKKPAGDNFNGLAIYKQTKKEPILPPLTTAQQKAIETIEKSKSPSFLLHGKTGSGKTRVYLELAKQTIAANKSVVILTPEIGLTPQLKQTFEHTFENRVAVLHSMLTPAERRNVWLRVLGSSEALVVIGPRSAVFSPVKSLGLVVMDEAHESSYKQEQAPYYQTSRVAAKLAQIHNAKFIMGTATPLVADYYAYEQKKLAIIKLSDLAIKDAVPPHVTTVNLNDRSQFSSSPFLAQSLITSIQEALDKKEQSLLYLNRRGSARVTFCSKCHWQALCQRCDIPLTYHGDKHELRCHICGYRSTAPNSCPKCGNSDITFRSLGTKALYNEVSKLFPSAKVGRFDTDNSKSERLESVYHQVKTGEIDILVGTQLIGKGLDLPNLSVVGVVQADAGLFIPDYTADETTYQQLVQIMGRVGRGHREGKVFIQTNNSQNVVISSAITGEYESFYKSQLEERKVFGFPPFYYLLKFSCRRRSPKGAQAASNKLKDKLLALQRPIEILGPAPSFYSKRADYYYWQIIVKAKHRSHLTQLIKELPTGWQYDIDPVTLL